MTGTANLGLGCFIVHCAKLGNQGGFTFILHSSSRLTSIASRHRCQTGSYDNGASTSVSRPSITSHTDLFALPLRTCFPQSSFTSYTIRLSAPGLRLTLGPLLTAAVDVRFLTSNTSDGTDPMYVLYSSIFVGFAVGN